MPRRNQGDAQLADQQGEAMSGLTEKSADPTGNGGANRRTDHAEANKLADGHLPGDSRRPYARPSPDAARTRRQAHGRGYPLVGDIKPAHEGRVAKATQDGKDVHLVVDSSDQIQKRD